MEEIKEDLNKWRDMQSLSTVRLSNSHASLNGMFWEMGC